VFPRRPKKEELQALVDRVVEASIQLGRTVPDFATAYVALNPLEVELNPAMRERAQDLVERIAVDWRAAELTGATEATVIEDLRAEDVTGLLAAIQDSLILALATARQPPDEILSIDEAIERVQNLANPNGLGSRHRSNAPDDPDFVARFDELEKRLLEAISDAAELFPRLAPEEGEFTERKRAVCREQLASLAACGRELDRERDLVAALVERRDLRPSVGVLRAMVQAFVLRLCDDPECRAQAIPLQELAERFVPVWADWESWH